MQKAAIIALSFLFVFSGLATSINTLNGWTVENGGAWAVNNSTFTVTAATSNTTEHSWSFIVNNTYLPRNYEIYARVKLNASGAAGMTIFYNLTTHLDLVASTYATAPCNDQFQVVKEVNGTRTNINAAWGPSVTVGVYYFIHIIKNGDVFSFYAGVDNTSGTAVTYTISDAILQSNVHIAFFGKNVGDTLIMLGVYNTSESTPVLNKTGFHRLEFTPNHWYKIVQYHSGNYSYIAFSNNYNTNQASDALEIYYLDSNFMILKSTTGPTVAGELYPMILNHTIWLPGHDGTSGYLGYYDPSTNTVHGVDLSNVMYITDIAYDAQTQKYFLMPPRLDGFFYETTQQNMLNPSAWTKVSIPTNYTPSSSTNAWTFRFTIWHNYIYMGSISDTQSTTNSTNVNYLLRYDMTNGTWQKIAQSNGTGGFNYPRSDYNTVTYALQWVENNTYYADFYVSHDGVHFTKIFNASVDTSAHPGFEKHAWILPILNSHYYYVEITSEGSQGKYFIIDENGTVYYNATVTNAAHSTIADPIVEQNRFLEGTEKWTREFWPSDGWVNDSFLQAMTLPELPISISTQDNGGKAIQVQPGTVIYAIAPYNGTLAMFYKRFDSSQTVYVHSNVTYNIGQIVQEHGNYVLIKPEQLNVNPAPDNSTNGGNSGGAGNPDPLNGGAVNIAGVSFNTTYIAVAVALIVGIAGIMWYRRW